METIVAHEQPLPGHPSRTGLLTRSLAGIDEWIYLEKLSFAACPGHDPTDELGQPVEPRRSGSGVYSQSSQRSTNGLPAEPMLALIIENQPNDMFAHFRGKSVRRFVYDAPSCSNGGASGKPSAVQRLLVVAFPDPALCPSRFFLPEASRGKLQLKMIHFFGEGKVG